MKNPLRMLIAQATLGKDAEEFRVSEVGRYMIGRARIEKALAAGELAKVYPWRKRKITQLQNRIHWAEAFEGWMLELINNGRMAGAAFDQIVNEAHENGESDTLDIHTGDDA